MKKILSLSILAFAVSCSPKFDIVRKAAHSKACPPGTVWLKDSTYIDQFEIRNLDYLEYIHWLEKYDLKSVSAALPDTTVWLQKNFYNAPYADYYLRHPAYYHYPVVGVSYEQATNYCKWRSERVIEFAKLRKDQASFLNLEYRLPNKEEWEYAAGMGESEFGYEKMIDKNNVPKVWVKETSILYFDKGMDIFEPVNSRPPNKFGIYGMIGNVAEMINVKGISKGGSVLNSLGDCATSDSLLYTKPEAWVGFRCVCVVKK